MKNIRKEIAKKFKEGKEPKKTSGFSNIKNLLIGVLLVLLGVSFFAGMYYTYPVAQKQGYEQGLTDLSTVLTQAGVIVNWQDNGNGTYTISVISDNVYRWATTLEFHMLVQHYRDGVLISETYHPMTVTDFGKDWVEQQLFTDVNYTDNALYISASNDESAVDIAWLILPSEITANGLERAAGDYASTGVGACTIIETFSITGTQSSCLYGINAGPYDTYATSLIAAEQQGSGARKNMLNGDTLAITVSWSHS